MSDLRRLLRDATPDPPDLDLRAVTARAAQLRARRRAGLGAAGVTLTVAAVGAAVGLGLLASPDRTTTLPPATPTEQAAASPTPTPVGGESVLAYYSPGSASSCDEVVPVERPLTTTSAEPAAALEQLFKGPTPEEQARGLTSFFGPGTEQLLRSVRIHDRTAYVDLNDISAINNVSTSCGSQMFLAQMDATVQQFQSVDQVLYAVEGDPGRFYRSLERSCPEELAKGAECDATPFRDTQSPGEDLPPQAPAVHGGAVTAVYLAIAVDPEDPDLDKARASAREAGYDDVAGGDLNCDQGAREALGLDPEQSYYSVALYFADRPTADRFVEAYEGDVVGVAAVTTYCLD